MNSKMTTNSQLSTNEPKRQTMKTRQTTRTGTESEKWIPWRDFSGEWEGRYRGGKVQGRSSIIGRHKVDGERLKMV